MVKFIHAADIHLDSSEPRGLIPYDGAPVEACRQATRLALENLIRLACDEQADVVLIAGDVYDGDWKDARTGLYFVNQIRRLREAGIRCYIIRGNHDAASEISLQLALPDNHDGSPMLLSHDQCQTIDLEDLGLSIHGQGFATRAVKDNLAANYAPKRKGAFNIGMLHTCLEGAEGHERYAPCTVQELVAREYQYWALGHIHQRNLVSPSPDVPIHFSGNLQGRHIRETGEKGAYVVTVQGETCHVEFKALDVYRWHLCSLDVSDCSDEDDVIQRFEQYVTQLRRDHPTRAIASRVELRGNSPLHQRLHNRYSLIMEQIRNAGIIASQGSFWLEEFRIKTKAPHMKSTPVEEGAIGELIAAIDELSRQPDRLKQLAQPLFELQRLLPATLLSNGDVLCPDDDQWLFELLEEVKPLLAAKLTCSGEDK